MELFVKLFENHKKINKVLLLFTGYCFSLLLFRAKITNSIYLFFLIWNLFLALIPYAIISYLKINFIQIHSKFKIGILQFCWLLFLPNSFYIITDLVHVVRSTGTIFYLDLIIISSFAIGGFVLGILSIIDFESTFESNIPNKIKPFLIPTICLLCGFGIYLGRILRFNSWDIISNPFQLSESIFIELLNWKTLAFSVHFGIFIYFSLLFKKSISK